MRLNHVVLADAANKTENGRMNILGIFDRITPSKIPDEGYIYPMAHLVIFGTANKSDVKKGKIKFTVSISRVDIQPSKEVFAFEGQMVIQARSEMDEVSIWQNFGLSNLFFPSYGKYEFSVKTEGSEDRSVIVEVAEK